MMYQVILFDLDDTLVDFAHSEAVGLKNIHERFYPTVDYVVFEHHFKQINDILWRRVGAKVDSLMPVDVRLLRFVQLNQQLECLTTAEKVADEYDHYLGEHAHWLPDVQKAIEFLHKKGHILGIITNGLVDVQGKKQQRLGLHQWFDCYIVSDEVGIAKPNREIFDFALQEISRKRNLPIHSYDKNSMLMVGDSMISDGHGAMNFGIHYCFINHNEQDVSGIQMQIRHHLSTVAHLPASIGYEEEYALYLRTANL